MNFVLLIIPSLIVAFVMKFKYNRDITGKEFLIHLGMVVIAAILALCATYALLYSKLSDVEVLNGEVTSKYKHVEWCTESSTCKHYTLREVCSSPDKDGKRSCHTYKDFDYDYEVDWYVESTVGESEIERVNSQGTKTPPRWLEAKIGEPASAEHKYMNYLFADEYSLFAEKKFSESYPKDYQDKIPDYPLVYDYYRASHVVNSTNHSTEGYEELLSNSLKTMGKEKQVNIVAVLYNASDMQYTDALISKWRGGKKNDVIMMFGLDSTGKVSKFRSISFAKGMKNEALHADLRISALSENMDLTLLQKQITLVNEKFNRLPNEEFKYMKYKIEPKKEVIIFISIVLMVLSIIVGIYMRDNDI